jgi:hypothetical protein
MFLNKFFTGSLIATNSLFAMKGVKSVKSECAEGSKAEQGA